MELERHKRAPTPTIATPSPPLIFIRTVNDFNAFCNKIKEVTKSEQFFCKSSINRVKLSNLPNLPNHQIRIGTLSNTYNVTKQTFILINQKRIEHIA
jgi:hypothetical protein